MKITATKHKTVKIQGPDMNFDLNVGEVFVWESYGKRVSVYSEGHVLFSVRLPDIESVKFKIDGNQILVTLSEN